MFWVTLITWMLLESSVAPTVAASYAVVGTSVVYIKEMQAIDCKELGGKI